jgi:hypothetical protein
MPTSFLMCLLVCTCSTALTGDQPADRWGESRSIPTIHARRRLAHAPLACTTQNPLPSFKPTPYMPDPQQLTGHTHTHTHTHMYTYIYTHTHTHTQAISDATGSLLEACQMLPAFLLLSGAFYVVAGGWVGRSVGTLGDASGGRMWMWAWGTGPAGGVGCWLHVVAGSNRRAPWGIGTNGAAWL